MVAVTATARSPLTQAVLVARPYHLTAVPDAVIEPNAWFPRARSRRQTSVADRRMIRPRLGVDGIDRSLVSRHPVKFTADSLTRPVALDVGAPLSMPCLLDGSHNAARLLICAPRASRASAARTDGRRSRRGRRRRSPPGCNPNSTNESPRSSPVSTTTCISTVHGIVEVAGGRARSSPPGGPAAPEEGRSVTYPDLDSVEQINDMVHRSAT